MRITQATGGRREPNPNLLFSMYFLIKLVPMAISALAIYLGYKLFILGVTGQASLSIKSDTVSGQLLNAAPGLFFAVGGISALIVSVFKGVSVDISGGADTGTNQDETDAPQWRLRKR